MGTSINFKIMIGFFSVHCTDVSEVSYFMGNPAPPPWCSRVSRYFILSIISI